MYDKLRIDFEDKTFINYHIFKKMNCVAGVLLTKDGGKYLGKNEH